jgi:hypothetical protein
MNKTVGLISCIIIMISIAGCAINRAEIATKAKNSMLGMSKQQVLQCMGVASNIQTQGNTEAWKYYSGGDYQGSININANNQYAYGSESLHKRSCEINILFSNDSVTNVLYSGRTGGLLSQGEQCAYAVSNCTR